MGLLLAVPCAYAEPPVLPPNVANIQAPTAQLEWNNQNPQQRQALDNFYRALQHMQHQQPLDNLQRQRQMEHMQGASPQQNLQQLQQLLHNQSAQRNR